MRKVRQKVFSPNQGIVCHGFKLLGFGEEVPSIQMNKVLESKVGW